MKRTYFIFIILALILAAGIWANIPSSSTPAEGTTSYKISIGDFKRTMDLVLGLDLRGGVQALLEADMPAGQAIDPQALEDARQILENRTNALGVSENLFQVAGEKRIVGEFPGLSDPEEILATIRNTGLLEFVDLGDNPESLGEGDLILTDFGSTSPSNEAEATPQATETTTDSTQSGEEAATPEPVATLASDTVHHTIMSGTVLRSVGVSTDETGGFQLNFVLNNEGAKIFADYTTKNVNKILAIVLDKRIISAPSIQTPITDGQGRITGRFTVEQANSLAIQMRYGALPIPFKVVESRVIGPTLGADSLRKSLIAGVVGFSIVILFMAIYYRIPGVLADLSILFYGLVLLTLFRLIPVTLTLPGIAGFLLSTGSALDSNILIFERFQEELRAGRTFTQAVELAWKRAWPSIRDSNIATLITCTILFMFGSSFGATVVKGFAITLGMGVIISILCAYFVTMSLLRLVVHLMKPTAKQNKLFGILD